MSQPSPRYHVLLVGIDAYARRPLAGCVNDIDAVQQLLIERARIPATSIRRLASPGSQAARAGAQPAPPTAPATLEHLRAELARLAQEARPDDRVLFYYSGHGTRAQVRDPDGHTAYREALAPVDVDDGSEPRLLLDHELNDLLSRIAGSVTCILDCCHSAGVPRPYKQPPGATARFLDLERDLGWRAPLAAPAATAATATASATAAAPRSSPADPAAVIATLAVAAAAGRATALAPDCTPAPAAGRARSLEDTQIVAACLAHELALEIADSAGVRHGLLTAALLGALAEIPDGELAAVPWSRIWQAIRAEMERINPVQHPWMSGQPGRAVLAGPPAPGDPGIGVRRVDDSYELEAGSLASVTESALVAIYGERPACFPTLGSDEDLAARRGLVRVTSARQDRATAAAVGEPFQLPPGARARVVEAGALARLRCAIVPSDPALAAVLATSPLLELIDDASRAQVRLEQIDGRWLLTDDVHDAHPARALLALSPAELGRARAVLEHYYRYALPLRMAEACRDLPGMLQLTVLACERELSAAEARESRLQEAPTAARSTYDLKSGALVCFRVHNASLARLRVTLLSSAPSGRVQLAGDLVLDPESSDVVWAGNTIGQPFELAVPDGRTQGIDRLTAIGTTAIGRDLHHLVVARSFREAREVTPKDLRVREPSERWTATQVILRTHAR